MKIFNDINRSTEDNEEPYLFIFSEAITYLIWTPT